jgi:hypothetical protein
VSSEVKALAFLSDPPRGKRLDALILVIASVTTRRAW